jgi:peptide-methionine (S)-S-oxide reductase
MRVLLPSAFLAAVGLAALSGSVSASELNRVAPRPALALASVAPVEVAYFAGGCFWGVEGVFDHVRGVKSAVSGYAGGNVARPTYETVSGGRTGHAETVRVTFDPRRVSYAQLLQVYFSVATDPTQLNRQGPDTGTHYRGAIFPTTTAQARQARAYIAQLGNMRVFPRPIVTKVEPLRRFTPAETYHQDFMARNPAHPYIVVNDRPKVAALRRLFPKLYV